MPDHAPGQRRGPLPIVLGVSGHRDLREGDVPALELAVGNAFDQLLNAYGNTPLLLLSPLAAGADRLVARVAMDRGIPVVAPLPLEQSEYERDFDVAETAEFRELVARARCSYFVGYVPAKAGEIPNGASNVGEPARRAAQYAQVGSYVVRNSQILIALWNGADADGVVGGTAQVVGFKRSGRAPGFGPDPGPLDRPEYGPVWRIVTPRVKATAVTGGVPFACIELWPERTENDPQAGAARAHEDEPSDAAVTKRMYLRIDRFNEDARDAGFDTGVISTGTILNAAEALAKRYQISTLRTLRFLYAAGFAATVTFLLYSHVWHEAWLLALDILITNLALSLYLSARNRELQNSHQDYRAIAEGLRVQEQWHKANLREAVADHYLRQHRGELDWIRNAIRVCRLLDDTAKVAGAGEVPLATRRREMERIRNDWIGGQDCGQIHYFTVRSGIDERNERWSGRFSWAGGALSILGTVVAAIVFGILGVQHETADHRETPLFGWLVVAIAVTAVASGLLASYAQKRAYAIHVKRYRRMRAIFRQAGAMLEASLEHKPFREEDYVAAQRVIRDLGEEALLENAAWVMLHRERPLEFVQGT